MIPQICYLLKLGCTGDVAPALRIEVGKWVARSGHLSLPPNPQPVETAYWHTIALVLPLLSKVALTIHAIAPTEAACERSFSNQGVIHSDLRASLNPSAIEAPKHGA